MGLISGSSYAWMIQKIIFGRTQHLTCSLIGELEKNEYKIETGFGIVFPSSMRCVRPESSDLLLIRRGFSFFQKTPGGCLEVFLMKLPCYAGLYNK